MQECHPLCCFLRSSLSSLVFAPHTAHGVHLSDRHIFLNYYFSLNVEYSLSYVFLFDAPFQILIFCTIFHDFYHMPYHSLLLSLPWFSLTEVELLQLFSYMAWFKGWFWHCLPYSFPLQMYPCSELSSCVTSHCIPLMSMSIRWRKCSGQEKAWEPTPGSKFYSHPVQRSSPCVLSIQAEGRGALGMLWTSCSCPGICFWGCCVLQALKLCKVVGGTTAMPTPVCIRVTYSVFNKLGRPITAVTSVQKIKGARACALFAQGAHCSSFTRF